MAARAMNSAAVVLAAILTLAAAGARAETSAWLSTPEANVLAATFRPHGLLPTDIECRQPADPAARPEVRFRFENNTAGTNWILAWGRLYPGARDSAERNGFVLVSFSEYRRPDEHVRCAIWHLGGTS